MGLFNFKNVSGGDHNFHHSDPLDKGSVDDNYIAVSQKAFTLKNIYPFYRAVKKLHHHYPTEILFFLQNINKYDEHYGTETKTNRKLKILDFFNAFSKSEIFAKVPYIIGNGFGSARTTLKTLSTQQLEALIPKIATRLKAESLPLIAFLTGGGPGNMEAFNRGCRAAGMPSLGVKIDLPFEKDPNQFMDQVATVKMFVPRVAIFNENGGFNLVSKGGWGTVEEDMSVKALKQLGILGAESPTYLYNLPLDNPHNIHAKPGERYFDRYDAFMKNVMHQEYGLINADQLNYSKTFTEEEALIQEIINDIRSGKISKKKPNGIGAVPSAKLDHETKISLKELTQKLGEMNEPKERGIRYLFTDYFSHNSIDRNKKIMRTLNEFMEAHLKLAQLEWQYGQVTAIITPTNALSPKMYNLVQKSKKALSKLQTPVALYQESDASNMLEEVFQGKDYVKFNTTSRKLMQTISQYSPNHLHFSRHHVLEWVLTNFARNLIFFPFDYVGMHYLFHILCLMQTGKIKPEKKPNIFLIDEHFHNAYFEDHSRKIMLPEGTISEKDFKLINIISDPREAVELINQNTQNRPF